MFTCCLFVSFCSPSIQRSFRSLSAIFKFFSQPYNRTSCVVRSTCTRQPLCSSNKATLGRCWLHDISLSKPVEFHFHYKSPWILPTATLLSKLVAAGRNSMLSCCPKAHYFLMPRMMACGHFPCHCKKKLFESAPLSSSQSSWMYWIAASEVVCVLETSSKKTSTRLPIAKWLLIHRLHTETPVNFCSLNQNCLKSVHNPEKKKFQIAMSLTLRPEDVSFIEFYHWTWVTCQIYSRLTTWQSRIVRPSFFRSICISNFLVNLTDPFHRSTPSARSTLPRLVRMSSAQTAGDTLRRWPGERSKFGALSSCQNACFCKRNMKKWKGNFKSSLMLYRRSPQVAYEGLQVLSKICDGPFSPSHLTEQFVSIPSRPSDHRTIHCFFDMRRNLIPTTHCCVCLVSFLSASFSVRRITR